MKNKILVTGASGNVGGHVAGLLKERGVDFVAGAHNSSIDGVKNVSIDYADVASLEKAMEGISTLFMLIPTDPEMVLWGKNVVDAAKKSGVRHIVRSGGSLSAINSPLKVIQILKATDRDVMESKIDYTITAPQFFMSNFIHFFANDYKNGAVYQAAGDGKLGWVDVRDIAAVNVEVLLNPDKFKGKRLAITGSENLSYGQAVDQMNEVLGKKSKYISVPDEAAIDAMKGLGFPPFLIDVMISLDHAIVQGYAEKVTDTVKNVTGRDPILFKQFVADNKEVWL